MLAKPNVKTKEGWQVWGKYGLILYLLLTIFFPDIDAERVMSSASEIAAWYKNGEALTPDIMGYFDQVVKGVIALYFGNTLRKPKQGDNSASDDREGTV